MELTEKKLNSKEIFSGKIVKLTLDSVELPDGTTAEREVVRHPAGVVVAPLTKDNKLLFVRQYRYPFAQTVLELPAGKIDDNSPPLDNAKRELLEETGAVGASYVPLGVQMVSPGFCDEIIYMYMCRVEHFEQQHLDEGEFLNVTSVPLSEAVEMVLNNRIFDGKTQTAVLKTHMLLSNTSN